jgi:predicted RNA-binding protein with PUA-like domain
MKYWLLKTEPTTYSWEDLKKEKNRTTSWEGIRNYQARNYIRDEMQAGDLAFLYHSVQKPPSIVGIVTIVKPAYPDHFANEPSHKYFDPRSKPDKPTWFMVDIRADKELSEPISIDEIKQVPELKDMVLLNNTRLSVQPVSKAEWDLILKMRTLKSLK